MGVRRGGKMSQPQENHQPLRVAILDGHGLMRDALARILEGDGMRTVVSSAEREEFLSQLQTNTADVALLDGAYVNDAVGAYAGGLIRQMVERFPATRPMVLSEVNDQALIDGCMQSGAWAYLFKQDATCQVLISAMRAVARGERLVPMNLLSNRIQTTRSNALSRLTPREREVLALLSAGADNITISARLGISERTVKGYTAALYQKLGADNRVLLAIKARELGMTPAVL